MLNSRVVDCTHSTHNSLFVLFPIQSNWFCSTFWYGMWCAASILPTSNPATLLPAETKDNVHQQHSNNVHHTLVLRLFCFNTTCQFTPFLLLHSRIFGLRPSGWPSFIMLTPYFWCNYHFLFMPFRFTSSFSSMQLGCQTRARCIFCFL
jgi:hypothetical protein